MPKASSKQKQRPSEPITSTSSLKRYPRSLNPVKEQDLGQDPTSQKKALQSSPASDYDDVMHNQEFTNRKVGYKVGYVAPARRGKVSVKTFVVPELRDDFKRVAKMLGTTQEDLLTDVITAVVEQYSDPKEAPEALAKNAVKRYQNAVRQAALRLAATLK